MEYPKIHSLWKREGWYFDQNKKQSPDYKKGKQSFIVGDYSEPEFANVKKWNVEEKVDGTNIRILYKEGNVFIMGRTENAQLPPHLLSYLQQTFYEHLMNKVFPVKEREPYPYILLFGEGYGPKIQAAGGNYRKDPGFILFDCFIGGWWLKREDVKAIADQFLIPIVPQLGIMTEEEIIDFVKSKPLSQCSVNPQMMEGVVCRSEPLMLFRNGKPITWKLKCKEF